MLAIAGFQFKHNFISATTKRSIAFLWYCGICLGIFAGNNVHYSFYSVMRSSLCGRVSIVWVLVSVLLPYLLLFMLQRAWGRMLFMCVLFLKAFCYSFSLLLLLHSFGSAGWLIGIFCLWWDALSVAILFWFVWRCANWDEHQLTVNYLASVAVTVFAVCIDHFVVGPFWFALL